MSGNKEDPEMELEAKVRARCVALASSVCFRLLLSIVFFLCFFVPISLSQIRVRSANQEAANDPEVGYDFTVEDTVRVWSARLLTECERE